MNEQKIADELKPWKQDVRKIFADESARKWSLPENHKKVAADHTAEDITFLVHNLLPSWGQNPFLSNTFKKEIDSWAMGLADLLPEMRMEGTNPAEHAVVRPESVRSDDAGGGIFKKIQKSKEAGDAKKAKRLRQAAKRKAADVTAQYTKPTTVGLKLNESFPDKDPGETVFATFPQLTVQYGWVRSAGSFKPIFKDTGKNVPRGEHNKPENKDKIKWVVDAEPLYYPVPKLDIEHAHWLKDDGLLPSALHADIIAQKVYADVADEQAKRGYTHSEFLKLCDLKWQYLPDAIFYWAQMERQLTINDMQGKIPWVNKWMRRLISVPESLRNQVGTVAEKLYGHIKHDLKNFNPINRTIYGFTCSQLANWKIGETRKDYLERCEPSIVHYWGPYANKFKEEWLALPDSQIEKRPKYDNVLQRQRKNLANVQREIKTVTEQMQSYAGAAANALRKKVGVLVAKASRIEETLAWWERARAMPGKLRANIAALYRSDMVYNRFNSDGEIVETIDRETSVWRRFVFNLRTTLRVPFKDSATDVTRSESGEETVQLLVQDRQWWSDTKAYFTSGFIPDVSKSPVEDVPVPIVWRAIFNIARGASTAVADGIPYAVKKVGAWFNSSLSDGEELNIPAPDVTPFFKGAAVMAAYELAGAVVSTVVGAPVLAIGAAFGTIELAAWGARLGWNTAMRWCGYTKQSLVDKPKPEDFDDAASVVFHAPSEGQTAERENEEAVPPPPPTGRPRRPSASTTRSQMPPAP